MIPTSESNPRYTHPTKPESIVYLKQETKRNKEEFYHLYGLSKNNKNSFTINQLNSRCSDNDFDFFKDTRAKLTNWLKMGLALSRQLEELDYPHPETETHHPLLTIESVAIILEDEFSEYLQNIEVQQKAIQKRIILEANDQLWLLHIKTRTILEG